MNIALYRVQVVTSHVYKQFISHARSILSSKKNLRFAIILRLSFGVKPQNSLFVIFRSPKLSLVFLYNSMKTLEMFSISLIYMYNTRFYIMPIINIPQIFCLCFILYFLILNSILQTQSIKTLRFRRTNFHLSFLQGVMMPSPIIPVNTISIASVMWTAKVKTI